MRSRSGILRICSRETIACIRTSSLAMYVSRFFVSSIPSTITTISIITTTVVTKSMPIRFWRLFRYAAFPAMLLMILLCPVYCLHKIILIVFRQTVNRFFINSFTFFSFRQTNRTHLRAAKNRHFSGFSTTCMGWSFITPGGFVGYESGHCAGSCFFSSFYPHGPCYHICL